MQAETLPTKQLHPISSLKNKNDEMTRFSNPFNKAKGFWKLKPRAITYFITEVPEGSNSLLHAILAKRYKLYALNNLQKEKQESG